MSVSRPARRLAAACASLGLVACAATPDDELLRSAARRDGGASPASSGQSTEPYAWELPPGFPAPAVPADNPMTVAKVELGRHLFYDRRLSASSTYSCATCHEQALAFTDGRPRAIGSTGQEHSRGSMSLANVAYAVTLTWGHPYLASLERQAQVPLFGDAPIELGQRSQAELEARFAGLPEYAPMFRAAFPGEENPVTLLAIQRALASFERTLISGDAPFDRWLIGGDEAAISDSAKRGFALFNTERFECYHCHGGFAFTDHVTYADQAFPQVPFHNTGLYNTDGRGAFPSPNTGVESVTGDPADMGRFKAPTLRNIAVTAPYMHDGSVATLSEVLDHYAAGGRTIQGGPAAGIGSASPLKSNFVRGFSLTEAERADLIAFLESLTDAELLENPRFSDPWR